MIELRRPALLDPRRHDRERFDSGEAALDEWLRRYAGQNRRRDTAATWVIADADDLVVAYASVAMTGIDRSAAPEIVAKGAPDPVPALLLGRLAVDRRYANIGIGTALAAHVLATAVELNEKAACRAVVVTALNQMRGRGGSGLAFIRSSRTIPIDWTSICSLPRLGRRSSERDSTALHESGDRSAARPRHLMSARCGCRAATPRCPSRRQRRSEEIRRSSCWCSSKGGT